MKTFSKKRILTVFLCGVLAMVSAFAVPAVAEAKGKTVTRGVCKFSGNSVVVYEKTLGCTFDKYGFEGSLAYGKTKKYKISKKCKYYVYDFTATGMRYKKVSKKKFFSSQYCPKSTKASYDRTINGVKYYSTEFLKLTIKGGKVSKMKLNYHP